jgi:iron complex outermembrane receptor protein
MRIGTTDTTALYGNIAYPVTDQFRLNLGVRKSWDEATMGGRRWNPTISLTPELNEDQRTDIVEYDGQDYNFGLEYDIRDNSMLFANYSSGYRLNNKGPARPGVDTVTPPEHLKAFTVGAKNRFFGNKLQLNASAYYYDYENYFTVGDVVMTPTDWNANGIADPEDIYPPTVQLEHDRGQLTTGDATVYGVDVQSSMLITEKDKLDFNISYIKKKFGDMLFDYYDITNYLGLADMRYDGLEMANAPHWTAKFDYRHNFNLPNGGVLTPRVEATFQSSYLLTWQAHSIILHEDPLGSGNFYWTMESRSDVRIQEAYHLADISVSYADPSGKWTLNFYINNVENYAVKRSLQGMGGTQLRLGPPRTFGGILTVRY